VGDARVNARLLIGNPERLCSANNQNKKTKQNKKEKQKTRNRSALKTAVNVCLPPITDWVKLIYPYLYPIWLSEAKANPI